MKRVLGSLLLLILSGHAQAASAGSHANPIRRVVNMLSMMQQKVTEEGKKEEELFNKFMCYCKTGVGELEKEVALAEAKIPKVEAALKESSALLEQLESEIKQHKKDRADAEKAANEAKALRAKEAKAFAKASSDMKANINAMGKAIAAIEKGTGKSFLQTTAAAAIRKLTVDMEMNAADRDVISSFLSGGVGDSDSDSHSESDGQSGSYAPQSDQIVGILKQMKDTMEADLKETTAAEETSIKDFEVLMAAKTKEIKANTKALESKLEREGQVRVEIEDQKEDLDDTKKSYAEDKKFLAELNKSCSTKQAEWDERCKLRSEELVAISDTIKILNDDDALELFKKTLPAPSFFEISISNRNRLRHRSRNRSRHRAAHRARRALSHHKAADPRIQFITMALKGKAGGFEKVLKMIDNMVALLGKEQDADTEKKAYCEKELDTTEDELKELEETAKDLQAAIDDADGTIKNLGEEIDTLTQGIADLDKQVDDATKTRKAENSEYKETMASDTAAKEILKMAQNRLNKFYAPKLYKPPNKAALQQEQEAFSFVQVRSHTAMKTGEEEAAMEADTDQDEGAPPPPPETFGAYKKKGQESGGVMEMMQMLLTDLEKDMTAANTQEKENQKEYEELMSSSAEKRRADKKSIADKEGTKAEMTAKLEKLTLEHKATVKEAYGKTETLGDLHKECDWLLSNYENRQAARSGEVESLKKAKAVLSGADYSLLQTSVTHRVSLRGSA